MKKTLSKKEKFIIAGVLAGTLCILVVPGLIRRMSNGSSGNSSTVEDSSFGEIRIQEDGLDAEDYDYTVGPTGGDFEEEPFNIVRIDNYDFLFDKDVAIGVLDLLIPKIKKYKIDNSEYKQITDFHIEEDSFMDNDSQTVFTVTSPQNVNTVIKVIYSKPNLSMTLYSD